MTTSVAPLSRSRQSDLTPAQAAVQASGLSLEDIARQASSRRNGLSVDYLRRLLRTGGMPQHIAERLGQICGCSGSVFLYKTAPVQHRRTEAVRTLPTSERTVLTTRAEVKASARARVRKSASKPGHRLFLVK